ncbi:MAG: four helix bundle protein [Candidatus Peribacteraceae bacterium]
MHRFAQEVRAFLKSLPFSPAHVEDGKQLLSSSGSIGANYIEANEAVSSKDFTYRLRICRKEAKESMYWLTLIECSHDTAVLQLRQKLIDESRQLVLIFAAILRKISQPRY